MKEIVTIGGLYRDRIGTELYNELYRIESKNAFEYASGNAQWALATHPLDPKLRDALSLLSSAGYRPRTGLVGRDGPENNRTFGPDLKLSFRMYVERTYSRADLDKCELLELMGYRFFMMLPEDDPQNSLWVTPEVVRSKADFVQNDSSSARNIIVPVRVRTLLVAGRFRHIDFRPVFVSKKLVGELTEEVRAILEARGHQAVQEERQVVPWEKLGEPWSELWSDLILPPLSPSCVLMDSKGNPYKEGVSFGGQFLHEGFYDWPEMRYRRSDLARVDDFDIALTYEQFGFGPPADYKRAKVVSRRFYQYCIDNGLKANWRPVRIEED